MLRVNLLPPYIYDKQKKVQVAVLWGVGLAAVIIGLIAWAGSVQSTLTAENAKLDQAKQYQDQYTTADTAINNVKTAIAATKAKQDFVANAQVYNLSWPRVYEGMASVTSPDILLKTMAVDGANHKMLHLTGFCESEMKLARWWMSLRNDVNMFDSVYISLPPHPYAPGGGNGARGRGGFAAGGFGGPGGFPGGMPGGAAPPSGRFAGMGMAGMGMGGPGGMSGMPSGMMSGMAGMGGGRFGGGQAGDSGEGVLEGRRGLNFVASLAVSDKLAPPAFAPTWPAGGGGGMGMGGFPGMGGPGGMMGGPGGMMGGPGGMPGMPGMPGGRMGGGMSGGPMPGMSGGPGGALPGAAAGGKE